MGLAEVARQAGLGKASLFHHFPTKAHLYCAVMVRALSRLEVELLRALAEGGIPSERFDRWIETFLHSLAAHPAYPGLLSGVLADDAELPAGLPDGNEVSETVRRMVTTALRLLAGELELEPIDTGVHGFRRPKLPRDEEAAESTVGP